MSRVFKHMLTDYLIPFFFFKGLYLFEPYNSIFFMTDKTYQIIIAPSSGSLCGLAESCKGLASDLMQMQQK